MADKKEENKKEDKKEEKKEEKDENEDDEDEEVEVPDKFKDLVEEIEQMKVTDLAELVKVLEDKFGVSPAAAAPAAAAQGNGGDGEEKEEKSAYDVVLKGIGEKKIDVIKAVRNITQKGLKDAKKLVDSAADEPQAIKQKVRTEDAEEMKKELEEAGAEVELK